MMFGGYRILSEIQVILLASFMALLIHQFEEYILPVQLLKSRTTPYAMEGLKDLPLAKRLDLRGFWGL